MEARVDEIADGIYRLSTFVEPPGMSFNQFLVDDDEPLLFHTGHRRLFPVVSEAIARITPLDRLRWIAYGHHEADECGALNALLAAAPNAEAAQGVLATLVSADDYADRPPAPLTDGQVLELGRHRVHHIDTPHVPHGWDARVLYEETTGTLLCGDLFTSVGDGPAVTGGDILEGAAQAEDLFGATCLTPATAPTIRGLADLAPTTLALMHGASFAGDGRAALLALADDYAARLQRAMEGAATTAS